MKINKPNNCHEIDSLLDEISALIKEKLGEIKEVALRFKLDDEAWYTPQSTIIIDKTKFFELSPDRQRATLAHECGHHILQVRCKQLEKYKTQIDEHIDLQEEVIVDWLVQYVLGIEILAIRDPERRGSIEYIRKIMEGTVTPEDRMRRSSDLL